MQACDAGLLLNNLSVYSGCEIVFDSSEVPSQAVEAADDVEDVQVASSTNKVMFQKLLGYLL